MDVLILSLCCNLNGGLLCGSLGNDKIKLDVCLSSMWNFIWMDGC